MPIPPIFEVFIHENPFQPSPHTNRLLERAATGLLPDFMEMKILQAVMQVI